MSGKAQFPKRLHRKGDSYYFVYMENRIARWVPLGNKIKTAVTKWKNLTAKKYPLEDYSTFDFDALIKSQSKAKPLVDFHKNMKKMFDRLKCGAKKRGIMVTITEQDLAELYWASNGKCAVTGIQFNYEPIPGCRSRPWVPSVDRIDNTKGYIPGNCRLVCHSVNMAMNEWGLDTLRVIASKIHTELEGIRRVDA